MPKIAYSEDERKQIKEALITCGLELFAKQGIGHTTVEQIYQQVGISRTFFYTFFPTKEDLVMQAFYCQQPKIINHAQTLMNDPSLSWKEGVSKFLYDLCTLKESRFVIMSIEEQQFLYKHISEANIQTLKEKQIQFFTAILNIFGIRAGNAEAMLAGNLLLSLAIIQKAIPETLPFLFQEAAEPMAELLISHLTDHMEKLRMNHSMTGGTQ